MEKGLRKVLIRLFRAIDVQCNNESGLQVIFLSALALVALESLGKLC